MLKTNKKNNLPKKKKIVIEEHMHACRKKKQLK